MNQLEKILKFRVILSSGRLETWRKAMKVTACDKGSQERVEIQTKKGKVCWRLFLLIYLQGPKSQ